MYENPWTVYVATAILAAFVVIALIELSVL